MTADKILRTLARGGPIGGRHVLVTAHPDDETVSASALLSRLTWAPTIVQITDGTQAADPCRQAMAQCRREERAAALAAAKWEGSTIVDAGIPGREAHRHIDGLVRVVQVAAAGADAVWTHPYEHGHLDHDTAALVVALALDGLAARPARMEFASYFMASSGRSVFGDFWPDDACPTVPVKLTATELARKRAAVWAYASQAGILRKFRTPGLERYRAAPAYDFTAPAAVPMTRWDVKGYLPATTEWRALARAARRASQ